MQPNCKYILQLQSKTITTGPTGPQNARRAQVCFDPEKSRTRATGPGNAPQRARRGSAPRRRIMISCQHQPQPENLRKPKIANPLKRQANRGKPLFLSALSCTTGAGSMPRNKMHKKCKRPIDKRRSICYNREKGKGQQPQTGRAQQWITPSRFTTGSS